MNNIIILIACFLIGISEIFAQPAAEFPSDRTAFFKEMQAFMTASKRKDMEELYKEFEAYALTIPQDQWELIVTTCNGMKAQKMSANPYFNSYFEALLAIQSSANHQGKYTEWHNLLIQMLADIERRKVTPYKKFVSFSQGFFQKDAIRDGGSGTSWVIDPENYIFSYEDKIPFIQFNSQTTLRAQQKNDTMAIAETTGTFWPLENVWKGKGGKISWERARLEDVYCTIDTYAIDVRKGIYKVNDVTLYFPEYFDHPIHGNMEDKLVASTNKENIAYPRFTSTDSTLHIENIGPGIFYEGGFRLEGATVRGGGTKGHKSQRSKPMVTIIACVLQPMPTCLLSGKENE